MKINICSSRAPYTRAKKTLSQTHWEKRKRWRKAEKTVCNMHTSNRCDTYNIEINVRFIIFYFRFLGRKIYGIDGWKEGRAGRDRNRAVAKHISNCSIDSSLIFV